MRLGRFVLDKATLLYALILILGSVQQVFITQRRGVLAVLQIFAPYLFLPIVVLLPLTFYRGTRMLQMILLSCVLIATCRFIPYAMSWPVPETPGATQLRVMTWNTLYQNQHLDELRERIRNSSADVIALQELEHRQAAVISQDPAIRRRYPYQLLHSQWNASGVGLLSRYPVEASGETTQPPVQWARIRFAPSVLVTVVNAHTLIGYPQPMTFDPSNRDAQLAQVRALIDPWLRRGDHVLLMGDFNLTERELSYHDLVAGLQDAHAQVGIGFGSTWRPLDLAKLPLGLLRIDYLLSSPHLTPLSTTVDCSSQFSDHCALLGVFELQRTP